MDHPTAASSASSAVKIKKTRSRIACKRCHDRRVRCDAEKAGTPCSQCREVNLGHACQLISSRRFRGNNGRFFCRDMHNKVQTTGSIMSPISEVSNSMQSLPAEHLESQGQNDGIEDVAPSETSLVRAASTEADVWSKVVSYDHSRPADGRRVLYVGEPWTLAYVMQWKSQRHEVRRGDEHSVHEMVAESPQGVHVQVPMDDSVPSPPQPVAAASPASITSQSNLSMERQQELIDSYFTRNHRLYPILNQQDFRSAFRAGTLSPTLALAVFYAAALHIPDPVIYRMGFDCRKTCLLTFYGRAKNSFFANDDDSSTDQLSHIQAAFLLHNMWQGPNANMDPWTWLGLGIRMAQNIGMHRSTRQSSLSETDQKLWKRIWWCYYARDRQIASALGKPLMIRDEDCDLEQLTVNDFEEGDNEKMRLFVMEQVKLGVLFGYAISSLFPAQGCDKAKKEEARLSLMQQLESWKQDLHPSLQFGDKRNLGWVHVSMCLSSLLLEVLFNCLILLIHRSCSKPGQPSSINQPSSLNTPVQAASAITQVAQTIMNHGALTDCPLFFTSALFGAMTIHVVRGSEGEQELGLSMIAMRSLSTMYFAAGWIRNLFMKLSEKRGTSRRPTRPSSPIPSNLASQQNPEPQASADTPRWNGEPYPDGSLDLSTATDMWQDPFGGDLSLERLQASLPQFDEWGNSTENMNPFGMMSKSLGDFINYSLSNDFNFS